MNGGEDGTDAGDHWQMEGEGLEDGKRWKKPI